VEQYHFLFLADDSYDVFHTRVCWVSRRILEPKTENIRFRLNIVQLVKTDFHFVGANQKGGRTPLSDYMLYLYQYLTMYVSLYKGAQLLLGLNFKRQRQWIEKLVNFYFVHLDTAVLFLVPVISFI